MNRRRGMRLLAVMAAFTAGGSLGSGGCDGQYPPCPEIDPVQNGDFRFSPSQGVLSTDELTLSTVTIDDDGLVIRYQRVGDDAPWTVRYRATAQFPDPDER